jgi:hypothetical protein
MPTADDFRTELIRMMHEAFKQGCEYVEIEAGELHRRLVGYPTGVVQLLAVDSRNNLCEGKGLALSLYV